MVQSIDVQLETIHLLEENIDIKILDISLCDDFLHLTAKEKVSKTKKKQVALCQSKQILHSKGNQQSENGAYLMGENVSKSRIW